MNDVYKNCPQYTSTRFLLRLVRMDDAADLLCCYGDPEAIPLFNSDNCTSDFAYHSLPEMESCLSFWLGEYQKGYYVRFAVVDKETGKAVGTAEIFNRGDFFGLKNVGVLRLDLCSAYENTAALGELSAVFAKHFYPDFSLEHLLIKAPPAARIRREVLKRTGYVPFKPKGFAFSHYFLQSGNPNPGE